MFRFFVDSQKTFGVASVCAFALQGLVVGCLGLTWAPSYAQEVEQVSIKTLPVPKALGLEELVVVGSKMYRPLYTVASQITVFDRPRLENELAKDFADIARYEPALEADFDNARFADTGISIRGIGGNRVAYELDDVPLPQQFKVGNFANAARTSIDPEIIQRIEVLRGPASVLYGSDALAGAVVITTVDAADLIPPNQHSAFVTRAGYYGADNSWLASATYAFEHGANEWLLSTSARNGHQPDNKPQTTQRDLVDYDQYNGFIKVTRRLEQGGAIRATFDSFRRDTTSDSRAILGFARFRNTQAIIGDDRQQRERISIAYELPELAWLEQGNIVLYGQNSSTAQLTDEQRLLGTRNLALQRDFFLDERSVGGEIKGQRSLHFGQTLHRIVAGIEWDRLKLAQNRDGSQLDQDSGELTNVVLGERFPLRDFPLSKVNKLGLYVQDEIGLGAVTLTPALRLDRYRLEANTDPLFTDTSRLTQLNENELTLRLGATWRVNEDMSAYAQYAEGFRAPPAEDINLALDIPQFNLRAIPNPELKSERSNNFETGLRWFGAEMSLETAIYYSRFSDFIESRSALGPDPVTGVLLFQSRNLAKASIYGFEASFKQSLGAFSEVLRPFAWQAAVHWARGTNEVTEQPLNSVNPWSLVLGLNWAPAEQFSADLLIRHIARQHRTDFSDAEFFVPPAATIVDLTARWQPRAGVQLQAGLFNLTDRRYWRFPDVRRFAPDDPNVDVLSQAGTNASVTLRLAY